MDIVVKYNVFNVGDNAATNVKVVDNGFRAEDFDLVSGQLKYKLERVAPGANSSQTVVVRPKKFGYFNFTAAEVTYSGEGGAVVLTGLSSDPGQGVIIAARDYDRQFSAHLLDWAAFAVMTLSFPRNPVPVVVVQQVQVRNHLYQERLNSRELNLMWVRTLSVMLRM